MSRRSNRKVPRRRSRKSHLVLVKGFEEISRRARQKANQRYYRGSDFNWKRAEMQDSAAMDWELPLLSRLIRWAVALLLLPCCLIATAAFFRVIMQDGFLASFWKSTEFWYFTSGFILMVGWFFTRVGHKHFLYYYVWGHEFTHAMFALICRGRVAEFEVTHQGGYIVTNKSNFIIGLAPYFFPFWTVIIMSGFTLASLFVEIPLRTQILYGLLGFTWAFHVLWTGWMIPRDQPDLKENDPFFSLVFIYLVNLLILSGLVCMAAPEIQMESFLFEWLNIFEDAKHHIAPML